MNDTPRTNAARYEITVHTYDGRSETAPVVDSTFCAELESELTAAQAREARLREAIVMVLELNGWGPNNKGDLRFKAPPWVVLCRTALANTEATK